MKMEDIFDNVRYFVKLLNMINFLEINYSKTFLFKLEFAIRKKDCIYRLLLYCLSDYIFFFFTNMQISRKEIIKNFNQFLRFPSESIFNF